MKKLIALICSIVFLLTTITSFAQYDEKPKKKYEYEKKKIYEKVYSLSAQDKVKINNQFGFVKVTTWDKNEVKVSVEMIASAKSESRVNQILDGLEIVDKKKNNTISFSTEINGSKSNNNGSKSDMEINYSISIPRITNLILYNHFGATILPDYDGLVDLSSEFGSLTTGKLTNVEEILVQFGKATIASIGNGEATFKFSKIEVGHLQGAVNLKYEFCNSSKLSIDNDVTSLSLNNQYSTINIKPSPNFNATYDVHSSFGSFKTRLPSKFTRTDEVPEYGADSDKDYEGKTGTGTTKVKIKSSFGNIIIGEATPQEMKDKEEKGGSKGKKNSDSEDDDGDA